MHKPSLITNHLLNDSIQKLRKDFLEVAKSTAKNYMRCDVKHEGHLYKVSFDPLPDIVMSDELPEPLMEVFKKILALDKRKQKIEVALRTMAFHIDELVDDPVFAIYMKVISNSTLPMYDNVLTTLQERCPQELKYLRAQTVIKTMD